MIILLDPPVTDIIVVYRFYDSLDDRVQGSPKSALGPYHVSVDGTEERNQCSTMKTSGAAVEYKDRKCGNGELSSARGYIVRDG